MTGIDTTFWMPSMISMAHMRATPPSLRISAGTRSRAITAAAPASSAILACSGVVTSMITPPLSISASPTLISKERASLRPSVEPFPPLLLLMVLLRITSISLNSLRQLDSEPPIEGISRPGALRPRLSPEQVSFQGPCPTHGCSCPAPSGAHGADGFSPPVQEFRSRAEFHLHRPARW